MNKSLLIRSLAIGFIAGMVLYASLAPQTIHADVKKIIKPVVSSTLVKDGHLTICKLDKSDMHVVKTVKMMITAYSSTEDQTDDTPFITASGKRVADGIIAINGLKFGTLVRIPDLYGDKIFNVQDRMHPRKGEKHADIWMASLEDAINFGAKITNIEIVES